MLPRLTRFEPRGKQAVNWLVFITFNAGLLMRVLFEPMHLNRPTPTLGLLLTISAWLQALTAVLFVVNAWRRVRTMQPTKQHYQVQRALSG